ncbi:hypothetical protein RchiOBHm_Chr1g0348941 [Rosa chinensis]|uniref:Uncharacterized protein n=1 Tax=Rosa chinensis TaxID=74649 RepID=A0A2P6SFP0_ROSCH|nr:hypothetical protein RchiOBHm_Chr1g0348941 [Rosa chinensis]
MGSNSKYTKDKLTVHTCSLTPKRTVLSSLYFFCGSAIHSLLLYRSRPRPPSRSTPPVR